jgi:SAM-dependent methyltransferase
VLRRTVRRGGATLACVFVSCSVCGHVFLNPQPTSDELNAFYDGDYHVFRDEPRSDVWVSSLLSERFDGARLNHAHVVKGGAYLDVGCGLGDMVAAARAVGMDAIGVDLSPIAVSIGRRQGRDLREGSIEAQGFSSDSFDSITMYHSLEHTPDPRATLLECARILKPGAVLMVAVPNFESLAHAVFGGTWLHLDPPYHLQQFSSRSLTRLGEAVGLTLTELQTESFVDHMEGEFARWARRCLMMPQRLSNKLRIFRPLARLLYHQAVKADRGDALIAHFHKSPVQTSSAHAATASVDVSEPL